MALSQQEFEKLKMSLTTTGKKPTVKAQNSFLSDAGQDIKETGMGIADSFTTGIREGAEVLQEENRNPLSKGASLFTKVGQGITRGIGELFMGAGKAVLPQSAEEKVPDAIDSAVKGATAVGDFITPDRVEEKIGNSLMGVFNKYESLKQTNPTLARELDTALGLGEIAIELAGLKGAGKIAGKGVDVATDAARQINIPKTSNILAPLRGGLEEQAQKSLRNDISDLLGSTRSLSKKSEEALRRNVDFEEILSDPVIYRGLKVENGSIVPDEAIDVVQNRIDALLESKRAILPEVDRLVPEISKDEIRKNAINSIRGSVSPADEKRIIARINQQIDALPETLKVSEIDKLRAQFRKSARDAKGIQKPDSHYAALENATRNIVFDVTDNLPVAGAEEFKALNDYIKSMITTQDFLDQTLRGQKVKGGRLRNYAMRGVGAIAGSQGGVVGALVGNEIGGVVADIITNNSLGSSIKMKLIRNMTDDPEIIRKAEELLGDIRETTAPLLEAGSSEFRSQIEGGGTINLPASGAPGAF